MGGMAHAGTCPATTFGGARVLLARVPASERDLAGARPEGVERWVAFERVVAAILGGDGQDGGEDSDLLARRAFIEALERDVPGEVPCSAAAVARDRVVYKLAMVGYSAADIARMFYREASGAGIDSEYTRRLAGYPAVPPGSAVARSAAPAPTPVPVPVRHAPPERSTTRVRPMATNTPAGVSPADPDTLDSYIRYYARAYQVDHRLVYAMIRHESNWDASSISPKGAIGLMQLMPATAAMLKVNPQDPVDNVRGGIAYLSDLLRTFGSVRHALIAYNAGPTHASQVLRGERALFDETRRYLQAIAAVYPLD